MKKNKELLLFYDKIYKKGEKQHYTRLLFNKTGLPDEEKETLKEISWKGKIVLDAGCGTGLLSYLIAKKGGIVTGVDYSKEAIKSASSNYKHKNLQFICSDFGGLKGKYDIVTSLGTLEHMDNPAKVLKILKDKLNKKGEIILTCPNWLNTRGYILMTLKYLFSAPITLADLHFLTPLNFQEWGNKLGMKLKWRTFDHSWASGDKLISDFKRRLPNVFRDMKISKKREIKDFIDWLENYVVKFDHKKDFNGAVGLYHFFK